MGKKIFLAGIAALLGGLILGNIGVEALGAVMYLAGAVGCIVGVIVGVVNLIRAWCARRRERAAREAQTRPKIVITDVEDDPRTPKTGLVIVGVAVALFLIAVNLTLRDRYGGPELGLSSMVIFAAGWLKWIYDFAQTHKSEKRKAAEAEAKRREEEWRAAERERRRLATTIVEVKLLEGGSVEFKRGGLKGAMIGGLLGGGIGAAVGAVMRNGKAVHTQRFAVKYLDGHIEIKDCAIGSLDYLAYMDCIKWEDI